MLTFGFLLSMPQPWSAPAVEVALAVPVDCWEEDSEEALAWAQEWAAEPSASPPGVPPSPTLSPRPHPAGEASGSNGRSGEQRYPLHGRGETIESKVFVAFLGQTGCRIPAVGKELE